jgi:RNA polymerase sigma factor (sigma-70 family)
MSSRLTHEPARLAGASLLRLQSDERLVRLAASGHEAAFSAIVDRYRAGQLRYCAGVVGSTRAEDVVQQTLINAHNALTKDPDVRHLRSWLYRIAHNASLNALRTVRDEMPLDPGQAAGAGDPAAALEQRERLRETLDAVRALPERQRAALLLRELEGRSHDEIADALGVTSGAARQHLMRARAAVRTAATAVTPYPLLIRLLDASATTPGGVAPWADAAAGGGLGVGVLAGKVGVGVLATTAVVGGAVGTRAVVHEHRASDRPAIVRPADASSRAAPGNPLPTVLPASATVPARGGAANVASGAVRPQRRSRHERRNGARQGSTPAPVAAASPATVGQTDSSSPAEREQSALPGREDGSGKGASGSENSRGRTSDATSGAASGGAGHGQSQSASQGQSQSQGDNASDGSSHAAPAAASGQEVASTKRSTGGDGGGGADASGKSSVPPVAGSDSASSAGDDG